MKNLFFFLLLAMLTTLSVQAQVNGPIIVSNDSEVCADSTGGTQTLTRVDISRVGENYPELSFFLNALGQKVVPGAGVTLTGGACLAMSVDDYEILQACDYNATTGVGTQFIRLIKISADATVSVSTYGLTGAPYTPTGTVYEDFCGGYDETNGEQKIPGNGATVTLTGSPYLEWTVTNAGLDIGTITYGGASPPAIIGMTWQCEFRIDPNDFSIRYCPDVTAAGGDFYFSSIKK